MGRKHTYEYIEQYFSDNGCELLEEEYVNSLTKMRYRCSCGNISEITFGNFQAGKRCMEFSTTKKFTFQYNYNPNLTDEERRANETRVHEVQYRGWRKEVFKKDDYCCQKCFTRGCRLNAHHIKNWAINVEGRYKISNGITFCEKCHNEFHSKYGKKNNNEEQVSKFVNTCLIGV